MGSFYCITGDDGRVVSNKQGNLQVYSFDPWGRRRNPDDWGYDRIPSYIFDRGYTGHQHIDAFNLINMNGRVYDPFVARFLSPDPFVQAPTYSQSYNRYTYAFNNPLKYTDPGGYYILPLENTFNNIPFLNAALSRYRMPQAGSGFWKYRYDWDTGQYERFFPATGKSEVVSYNEVFNNYVRPNSTNITSGMNLYEVNAFGRTTLVSAFGALGKIYIANNGGIFFSNPSASAYAGEANVFGNGQAGGGDFSLAGMYMHFQVGGGEPMTINLSSIDFLDLVLMNVEDLFKGGKVIKKG